MENLVNRKVRGFKFEDVTYNSEMDKHIGEIGTIRSVGHGDAYVDFKHRSWCYPLDQIEAHLVPKEEPIINKLPLEDLTESIDLKINLKRSLGGIDNIEYKSLTINENPELFLKITQLIADDMAKNINSSLNN